MFDDLINKDWFIVKEKDSVSTKLQLLRPGISVIRIKKENTYYFLVVVLPSYCSTKSDLISRISKEYECFESFDFNDVELCENDYTTPNVMDMGYITSQLKSLNMGSL